MYWGYVKAKFANSNKELLKFATTERFAHL